MGLFSLLKKQFVWQNDDIIWKKQFVLQAMSHSALSLALTEAGSQSLV